MPIILKVRVCFKGAGQAEFNSDFKLIKQLKEESARGAG